MNKLGALVDTVLVVVVTGLMLSLPIVIFLEHLRIL